MDNNKEYEDETAVKEHEENEEEENKTVLTVDLELLERYNENALSFIDSARTLNTQASEIIQTTRAAQPFLKIAESISSQLSFQVAELFNSPLIELSEMLSNLRYNYIQSIIEPLYNVNLAITKSLNSMTKNIDTSSIIKLADSISKIDVSYSEIYTANSQGLVFEDTAVQEVHDKVVETSEIEEELTGKPIPYNVLSMEYVFSYLIPSAEVLNFVTTYGIVDPSTAIIIFMLVTINLNLYKLYKNNKTSKIEFLEDGGKKE